MGMAYVRIFYDWLEATKAFNAEEKGRLIDGIVLYAREGRVDERMTGNERFVFPVFQRQVDRDIQLYAQARTRRAERALILKDNDKDNDKEKDKDNDNEKEQDMVLERENKHWKTSKLARKSESQQIVDCCISENLPCSAMNNLFDEILSAMENGLEPGVILECCRRADKTGLGFELYSAMQARGLSAR